MNSARKALLILTIIAAVAAFAAAAIINEPMLYILGALAAVGTLVALTTGRAQS